MRHGVPTIRFTLAVALALAGAALPVAAAEPTLQEIWAELQAVREENRRLQQEVAELRAAVQPPPAPLPAVAPVPAPVASATTVAPVASRGTDLRVYGTLRGHLAQYDDKEELQDAVSRVGFRFDRGFSDDYTMFAGAEFGLNFFDAKSTLSVDPNGAGDFASVAVGKSPASFAPRLGFLGLDFADAGAVSIGKQNSVYKDVADWPDQMDVLTGKGTFSFSPSGTDGGEFGTGRADNALIYRNDIGALKLGLQVQFNAFESTQAVDSYGASLRYLVFDGLTLGASYQQVSLDPSSVPLDSFRGLDGDPRFFAGGFEYSRGPFYLAGVYSEQENGNFVTLEPGGLPLSVFYGASGFDVMGHYAFTPHWRVYLGASGVEPDSDDVLLHPDFRLRHYTLGLQYAFAPRDAYEQPPLSFYLEAQVDDSIDASGNEGADTLLLGLRYRFDHTWKGILQ